MTAARNPMQQSLLGSAFLRGSSHRLFASQDLDETRAMVARVMKPHGLGVAGRAQQLGARMHHASLGEVSVSRLKYGAEVCIQPDRLEDFFLVQMPLAGHAEIHSGDDSLQSTSDLASVLSPSDPIRMRWSADADQLMVRIPRRRLERCAAAQLGRELDAPLRFELGMSWQQQPAWTCLLSYLLQCAEQGVTAGTHRLLAAQIDQLVASTLLCVQPHSLSHARPARCGPVLPRHVRRVEEYLQTHADQPISADQLAALAGVSLRSLYAGFQQFCGTSPMQYLKQIRLDRARADLLGNSALTTVAGIALAWGFDHLGRFSVDYRKRFGESPSDTLRRRG